MRSGKEDGYGMIYDVEGKPLLLEGETMITFGKGYYDPGYLQTGGYSGVAKGITYLTNKRILFIGATSWLAALPEHSFGVAHFAYQADGHNRIHSLHPQRLKDTRLGTAMRLTA